MADTVRPTGSKLVHLYSLPKTHKDRLAMRPILSATKTNNYYDALSKWLDTKLKPLSLNRYIVTDIFEFANEIHNLEIANGDTLVSYDVSSLFRWNYTASRERSLHRQLVQYKVRFEPHQNGSCRPPQCSYKRTPFPVQWSPLLKDWLRGYGVPHWPLTSYVFMSQIEENPEREGKLPSFYRRYVDDTLTIMPNIETASNFLETLNKEHSSVKFRWKLNAIECSHFWVSSCLIATNRDKSVRKTQQFRFTLAPSESCQSCWQSLRKGFTENYAWSSTSFNFILDTFFRRM